MNVLLAMCSGSSLILTQIFIENYIIRFSPSEILIRPFRHGAKTPKIECHVHKEELTSGVPLNKPRASSRRTEQVSDE